MAHSNDPTATSEPTASNGGEPGADTMDALTTDDALRAAEQRAQEAESDRLRAVAELQNLKRRQKEEIERIQDTATKDLVLALLPVVDDLERALAAAGTAQNAGPLFAGVELTLNKLLGVLRTFGVERIPGVGTPFDPTYHEAALQTEPTDAFASGTISQELRSGYTQHGHVIRPSLVAVAHA